MRALAFPCIQVSPSPPQYLREKRQGQSCSQDPRIKKYFQVIIVGMVYLFAGEKGLELRVHIGKGPQSPPKKRVYEEHANRVAQDLQSDGIARSLEPPQSGQRAEPNEQSGSHQQQQRNKQTTSPALLHSVYKNQQHQSLDA